jgi:N-acetylneuraminate synthase
MSKKITINNRDIGTSFPPYIIAELSANHNGSLDTALKIIEEAKRCGADAIKLQTYSADTITLNSQNEEFMIRGGLWDGQSLYELYQKSTNAVGMA